MIMLIGLRGEGGILGSLLGSGQGNQSQINNLIEKIEMTGKRAAVIYKRQQEAEAVLVDIAKKLDIEIKKPEVTVDYGQEEIIFFKKMIKEMEESGEEVGILTKIQALRMLLSLFSKMSKNIGSALEGVKRTEQMLKDIQEGYIKEEDAGSNQHPFKGGGSIKDKE